MSSAPPSTNLRDRLLDAMLAIAPSRGWTAAAMREAGRTAGLSPGEVTLAAPNGPIDLAEALSAWADDRMAAEITSSNIRALKVRARVTAAVRARLEALSPHKEAVKRTLVVLAAPGGQGAAARMGWRTADRIWRELDDKSTDENFYSKRAILAAVHAATLLRWVADSSPGETNTWAFLDDRIAGVMRFEKIKAGLKPVSAVGPIAAGALARLRYAFDR